MLIITVTEKISNIPNFYFDENGQLNLDLFTDTELEETSRLGNNLDSISSDAILEIDIPTTLKNRLIFESIGAVDAFIPNSNRKIKVSIDNTGLRIEGRTIQVTSLTEDTYTVSISGKVNAWIDYIKSTKIKDLDLGNYLYNIPTIQDTIANNFTYTDDGSIVFTPLVNYGKWKQEDVVSYEDYRLWLSPLGILQQAFCETGFKFRCPLLESDYGRRLWLYLLKPNFADTAIDLDTASFRASYTFDESILNQIGPLAFDDDFSPPNFDPNNLYDPSSGRYGSANITADYYVELDINYQHPSAAPINLGLRWVKRNSISGVITPLKSDTFDLIPNAVTNIIYKCEDVTLGIGETIEIQVFPALSSTATAMEVLTGSTFYNEVKKKKLGLGDTIVLGNIIRDSYKVIDLLKGLTHLYNFKVLTNEVTKEVFFFTEQDADLYGEQLEGYFNTDLDLDWTRKINRGSYTVEAIAKPIGRNLQLGFKDSSDAFIAEQGLDTNPYLKEVDFGDDFLPQDNPQLNPFFEPTLQAFDLSIAFSGAASKDGVYIPFIWDTPRDDDGSRPNQAQNINPRICLAYPSSRVLIPPTYTGLSINVLSSYRFNDGTGIVSSNFYNPFGQIWETGLQYRPQGTGTFLDFEETVVYDASGYRPDLDGLYEILHQNTFNRVYLSEVFNLVMLLDSFDISQFSHRNLVYLEYTARMSNLVGYFRVLEYSGFTLGRTNLVQLTLQADRVPVQESDLC